MEAEPTDEQVTELLLAGRKGYLESGAPFPVVVSWFDEPVAALNEDGVSLNTVRWHLVVTPFGAGVAPLSFPPEVGVSTIKTGDL